MKTAAEQLKEKWNEDLLEDMVTQLRGGDFDTWIASGMIIKLLWTLEE